MHSKTKKKKPLTVVLLHRQLLEGGQMNGVAQKRDRVDEKHVDRTENAAPVHRQEATFVHEGHCAGVERFRWERG